jgi:hypothetical protein
MELQAISQAARVLEQRLSAHQEAVQDSIADLQTGKSDIDHIHNDYNDIPGLWGDISFLNEMRNVPAAHTAPLKPGQPWQFISLPSMGYIGLGIYGQRYIDGTDYFTNGPEHNGVPELVVKKAGWYLVHMTMHLRNIVTTHGTTLAILRLQVWTGSAWADRNLQVIGAPINNHFPVSSAGVIYLDANQPVTIRNPTAYPIDLYQSPLFAPVTFTYLGP